MARYSRILFNYGNDFNKFSVFTIVAGVTLAIANCIVKQRPNTTYGKTQMDWDMFKDVSFLLMSASKYICRSGSATGMIIFDQTSYCIYSSHPKLTPTRRFLLHLLGHLFQLLLHRRLRAIPPPARQPRIRNSPDPHECNKPPRSPAPSPPLRSLPRPRQHHYSLHLPHCHLSVCLDWRRKPYRYHSRCVLLRLFLGRRAGAVQSGHLEFPRRQ